MSLTAHVSILLLLLQDYNTVPLPVGWYLVPDPNRQVHTVEEFLLMYEVQNVGRVCLIIVLHNSLIFCLNIKKKQSKLPPDFKGGLEV